MLCEEAGKACDKHAELADAFEISLESVTAPLPG